MISSTKTSFLYLPVSNNRISISLKNINLPVLSMEQSELCELTKKEVKDALNKMKNNKTQVNYGLPKEFLETFWLEIKSQFLLSFIKAF